MSKSSRLRKATVKELDRIVSLIVRKKTPYCVICGKTTNLTCGHLFSRRAYSTRWDLQNLETQCIGCNLSHVYNPYKYFSWYIAKYGQEQFDDVYKRFNSPTKITTPELLEMLEDFKNMLRSLA